MERKGFTLAEVLITLAIIGVVAALTIPSVIVNAREQGNITGFKKAISVLNSAVSLNDAIDGINPSSVSSASGLAAQLSGRMNVLSSSLSGIAGSPTAGSAITSGVYFTTADGMQFIMPNSNMGVSATFGKDTCVGSSSSTTSAACTAAGGTWKASTDEITFNTSASGISAASPYVIVVDVNGPTGPNTMSSNVNATSGTITDRFTIMVTPDGVQAAGAQAQTVMNK